MNELSPLDSSESMNILSTNVNPVHRRMLSIRVGFGLPLAREQLLQIFFCNFRVLFFASSVGPLERNAIKTNSITMKHCYTLPIFCNLLNFQFLMYIITISWLNGGRNVKQHISIQKQNSVQSRKQEQRQWINVSLQNVMFYCLTFSGYVVATLAWFYPKFTLSYFGRRTI